MGRDAYTERYHHSDTDNDMQTDCSNKIPLVLLPVHAWNNMTIVKASNGLAGRLDLFCYAVHASPSPHHPKHHHHLESCYSLYPFHVSRLRLLIQSGREVAVFALVVPALAPRGRTERAVGNEELFRPGLVVVFELPARVLKRAKGVVARMRTWRQGLKSSPLARMHLW